MRHCFPRKTLERSSQQPKEKAGSEKHIRKRQRTTWRMVASQSSAPWPRALALHEMNIKMERFRLNRTAWLVSSVLFLIIIGLWPFDTRIMDKTGYICILSQCRYYLFHQYEESCFRILAIPITIWFLVSALLGWTTAAIFSIISSARNGRKSAQQTSAGDVTNRAAPAK